MAQHPDLLKWRELAAKELRGKPIETLNWKTPEGIQVKPRMGDRLVLDPAILRVSNMLLVGLVAGA